MKCIAAFVALGLLCGCNPDDPIAYVQGTDRILVVLDDGTPERSWTVHVESNDAAMRDGMTWTTLDLGFVVTPTPIDPWQEQWVDAQLVGDEPVEVHLQFGTPVQAVSHMSERYQAECVAGEACTWDYLLVMSRREGGVSDMALDLQLRALLTLGYESYAPEGATLAIEAIENVEE